MPSRSPPAREADEDEFDKRDAQGLMPRKSVAAAVPPAPKTCPSISVIFTQFPM
jgi:hypothetical protein